MSPSGSDVLATAAVGGIADVAGVGMGGTNTGEGAATGSGCAGLPR